MLSDEDNAMLCRVGPGTPMGRFMRRFWVPALRAAALEAGGAPRKLRLLGQDFVAFRGHDGRVGVLDENCPHRGVSLTLARNEDCALTCVFHGWRIDADGRVIDVPAEPAEHRAQFAARVTAKAYPARDRAGIVWVWLGAGAAPALPNFAWMTLPDGHIGSRVGLIHASWLNGLEGQLDSAHVGILHQDWVKMLPGQARDLELAAFDLSPRFEFEEKPYGYREAAVRNTPEGSLYVRIREFVAPWYSFIPSFGGLDSTHLVAMSIPVDDEYSLQWDLFYNPVTPLTRGNFDDGTDPDDLARGMGGIDRRFGQDRRRMRAGSFSGFGVLRHEDYAVAMAQGVWADRAKEQLSSSDAPIVRARRHLLAAARATAPDDAPPAALELGRVRGFSEMIPRDRDWRALPVHGPEAYAGDADLAE